MKKQGEIFLVPLVDIRLNPANRNIHTDEQIERLAEIIEYQGFREPGIISTRSGFLISGEGRYFALQKLKATHMPCMFQDFESDDQEYAFGVSTNAIAKWARLDLGAINFDLPNLSLPDIDLLGIKNFQVDMSEKELKKPICERGQTWFLGTHRLIVGDDLKSAEYTISQWQTYTGEKAVLSE